MSPRTSEPLRQARQADSHHKRQRTLAALRDMQQRGQDITYAAVARHAGVSLWLTYATGIREHIETARAHQTPPTTSPPAAGPGTAGLRTDLELARTEITALRGERDNLRDAVRRHLGHQLDTLHTSDLVTRIDELTTSNNQLQTENNHLTRNNTALRHQLTETENALAAARTSLRQMIKDQNATPETTVP